MGILKLRFAIYILMAVLAVQKLSHEADITSPSNNFSTNKLESNSLADANNTVIHQSTKPKEAGDFVIPKLSAESVTKKATLGRVSSPIALPESLVLQEIAPKGSRTSKLPSAQLEQDAQKVVVPTVVSPAPQSLSTDIALLETEVTSAQTSAQKDGSTMPMVQPEAPQLTLATKLAAINSHNTRDLQGVPTSERSEILLSSGTPTRKVVVVGQATPLQSRPEEVEPFAAVPVGVQKDLAEERGIYLKGEQGLRETVSEQEKISPSLLLTPGLRPAALTPPHPFTIAMLGTEARQFNDPLTEPLTASFPPSLPVTLKAPETVGATTSASSPEVEILQATSLPLVAQRQTPQVTQAPLLAANLQRHSARDLQGVLPLNQSAVLLASRVTPTHKETVNPQQNKVTVAQSTPVQSRPEVERLQDELRALEGMHNKREFRASPALNIVIPTGFGADNNTGFISGSYQQRTRDVSGLSDGGLGFGIGLGDARKSVGVELSYTTASFGNSRDFGSGGFNVKVHRQLRDDLAVAIGWNGFLNLGDRNDFEQSFYGVATKIFRTRDDINLPFSRIAVTAGIGNGQFETVNAVANGDNNVNVFGNVAIRVAQPVSLIAEWSGEDLGVGLSIAPFKNIPLVITPAVRDLAGAGDGPRFVLGTGFAFKF